MQKLTSWAQGIDRRHRALLQFACAMLLIAAFTLISVTRGPAAHLAYCSSWNERKVYLLMFAALYIATMVAFLLIFKRQSWDRFAFVAVLVLVGLIIRIAVFNQITADYASFLQKWLTTFRQFDAKALAMEVGDYNLPYQYLLLLIARTPLNGLYMIKFVSIVFDFAMALLMMRTVERFIDKKYGLLALAIVLLIPTSWFNSAFWAQCDALYCFFVLACVYAMLADRPILSVAMLALAFSFKIQTIFFFPIVLLALWGKKYKLRHAWAFVAVYLITLVPALFAGRSLMSALTIYFRQAAQYDDRLTWNAVNIYQFFPVGRLEYQPTYQTFMQFLPGVDPMQSNQWFTPESVRYLIQALVPFAGMVILSLVYYLYLHRKWINMGHIWKLSLAFTLLIPMILPKMHDRYFALAEMFAILYAIRNPKRWYLVALVSFASFESFMPFLARERPVDLRIAAAMMIVATGIVLFDVLRELRQAKAGEAVAVSQ